MSADAVCGADADGVPVTDTEVLDGVRTAGSVRLVRGPADRLLRSHWADELSALALGRGLRLSIRVTGRLVLVLDVDWSGWAEQAERPDEPDGPGEPDGPDGPDDPGANHPSRARGPRLVR